AANGPSAQLVTEVRHCSLNPRVAPGPILTGHAHHQRGQFFACAGPTRTPSFKKVHFRATSSRCQRSSVSGVTIVQSSCSAMRPSALAFCGKLAALGVSKDDAPSTEAFAKHAILGFEVIDRRRLSPLQPTSNQHEQELKQSRG